MQPSATNMYPNPATNERAAARAPSTEERLLGAASHLLLFMGFWVIGPMVLYFWQKERSQFVAFHAVQATLTAVLMLLVGSTIGIVFFVGAIATSVVIEQAGGRDFIGLGILLFMLVVMLLAALPTLWALYAAWKAYHGECWRIPIIGRLARRLVPEQATESAG